jgi:hypothetical protein
MAMDVTQVKSHSKGGGSIVDEPRIEFYKSNQFNI